MKLSAAAMLAAVSIPAMAGATTVREADLPGGAFGSSYLHPTEIGAGIDRVTGIGSQNVFDTLLFTGLPSGAQQIRIDFEAPTGYGYSYSAGGVVFYGTTLANQWDWSKPSRQVQVGYHTPAQSIVLDLLDTFSGNLFVALNFTHGTNLAYTVSAPSNAGPATPSAVPLPAGLLLIGTAMGGLGLAGLRRRRAA
jgi:hypothetical protein